MPAGRPTAFKPEFVEQATKLAKLAATDIEIADFFGVNVATLYRWKNSNAEFCEALKIAKAEADERVERSLFQRATGYQRDSVKVFLDKNGEPVYAPYREDVQPDTTACIFWLKNRKKEEWRDKQDHEVTGSDGGPLKHQHTVQIEFVKTGGNGPDN
jgi:hypothetical protein